MIELATTLTITEMITALMIRQQQSPRHNQLLQGTQVQGAQQQGNKLQG